MGNKMPPELLEKFKKKDAMAGSESDDAKDVSKRKEAMRKARKHKMKMKDDRAGPSCGGCGGTAQKWRPGPRGADRPILTPKTRPRALPLST